MKRIFLILSIFTLAAGCSRRDELEWPATEPGRHSVGHREATLTYSPGAGAREGEAQRSLRLSIWYPTTATSGAPVKYLGLERAQVHGGAPLTGEDLPVMIYSHGHLGFAEGTGWLSEWFASHGFVVVAPDHTGDTFENLVDPLTTELFLLRPLDIIATLDWLEALPETDPLHGKLSGEIILSGHSFGGYTAFAVAGAEYVDPERCETKTELERWCSTMTEARAGRFRAGFRDERVAAFVALAPGSNDVLGPEGVAAIDRPVLLATGGLDQQVEGEAFWPELSGEDHRWLSIPRAGHHTFSVTCDVLPGFGRDDGCGGDALALPEAYALISAHVLAFARLHLFGDEEVRAIVDGTRSLSPELTVHRK